MISIKIFESFDKNLEKIFKDIIKKNKINIFQSEEWIKSNIKIYNKNKYTKVIFVVYFKENQPCRTTVEVVSLPTPIAIELKCIATID